MLYAYVGDYEATLADTELRTTDSQQQQTLLFRKRFSSCNIYDTSCV